MSRLFAWRPLNGWRVFAGEVGVVLLGILLALGAQQAVEAIDRRQNLAFAEQAIRDEILTNAIDAYERLLIEPCLKTRLTELSDRLAAGGRWRADPMRLSRRADGIDPAFAAVYRTPSRLWTNTAWTMAIANGIVTHMDRARVGELAQVYTQLGTLRERQNHERAIAPLLTFLNRDQPLDPATRIDAQSTLARLDVENEAIVTNAGQVLDAVRGLAFGYAPAQVTALAENAKTRQRSYRGACVRNLRLNL